MSDFNLDDLLKASTTPAAKWRASGEADPHDSRYDCERSDLAMGDLTDDEMANAVFIHGDKRPSVEDIIAGKPMPIAYLTAAKDRIRWLSRSNERLADTSKKQTEEIDAATKALEFAEYMASSAESFLAIGNQLAAAEESDDPALIEAITEQKTELFNRVQSDIYEYRKRSALIKAQSPARKIGGM